MSLQSFIDWFEKYSQAKRQEICCGVWPFAVPGKFDPFLDCCAPHDEAYRQSEVMFAEGVVENNDDKKHRALAIKDAGDQAFFVAVNARIDQGSFLTRPFLRKWGETYIDLVMHNSNKFWFGSVGAKIAAFESGETPVIQLALRESGYAQEKEIGTKAHS